MRFGHRHPVQQWVAVALGVLALLTPLASAASADWCLCCGDIRMTAADEEATSGDDCCKTDDIASEHAPATHHQPAEGCPDCSGCVLIGSASVSCILSSHQSVSFVEPLVCTLTDRDDRVSAASLSPLQRPPQAHHI